jgi:hypothetical protein
MKPRSRWPAIAAGGIVVAAGFTIAVVELLRFPKGSVWIVVGAAALLLFLLRVIGRP